MSFTIQSFIDDCLAAIADASVREQHQAQQTIAALVGDVIANAESVVHALGQPKKSRCGKIVRFASVNDSERCVGAAHDAATAQSQYVGGGGCLLRARG